jgi:hypothetical protein
LPVPAPEHDCRCLYRWELCREPHWPLRGDWQRGGDRDLHKSPAVIYSPLIGVDFFKNLMTSNPPSNVLFLL